MALGDVLRLLSHPAQFLCLALQPPCVCLPVSLCLSPLVSVSLFLCFHAHLSVYLSLYLCPFLPQSLFPSQSICLSFCLSLGIYLFLSLFLSLLSPCVSLCLSLCPLYLSPVCPPVSRIGLHSLRESTPPPAPPPLFLPLSGSNPKSTSSGGSSRAPESGTDRAGMAQGLGSRPLCPASRLQAHVW